jgi:hypothetical protein
MRAFTWWCEGLAAAMLAATDALRQSRRYRLRADARPFVLFGVDGTPVGSLQVGADGRIGDPPAQLL